jgi:hypothetical protein
MYHGYPRGENQRFVAFTTASIAFDVAQRPWIVAASLIGFAAEAARSGFLKFVLSHRGLAYNSDSFE